MLTETIERDAVAAFFDERAAVWDARRKADDAILERILDLADIRAGLSVLDVGCGTGVLFPRCLARGVSRVTGVDLSAGMLAVARATHRDERIVLVNADVERAELPGPFDRAVVLNALPHFPSPERLAARLAALLESGGRVTIAHDLGRDRLNALHGRAAGGVSRELMSAEDLAAVLSRYFLVDAVRSDERSYAVSGVLRPSLGSRSFF